MPEVATKTAASREREKWRKRVRVESAHECKFNNMQGQRMTPKAPRTTLTQANRAQIERTFLTTQPRDEGGDR